MTKDILKFINCIICDKDFTKTVYQRNDIRIVKCINCGLIYQSPQTIKEQDNEIYNYGYYKKYKMIDNKGKKKIFEKRFNKFFKNKSAGCVLDIGCGMGEFLEVFKKHNWEIYGIEKSSFACRYSSEKLGIEIFNKELKDINFKENVFDVIHLHHVLEHSQNPLKILFEIKRILKCNGLLMLEVPNENCIITWINILRGRGYIPQVLPPEHYYFFTKNPLKKLLKKVGFKIEIQKQESLNSKIRWEAYPITDVFWKKVILKSIFYSRIDILIGLGYFIFVLAKK